MNKTLCALLLSLLSGLSTAGPVLTMNPVQTIIDVGTTTTVSIDLSGAVDVYAFQFDVFFTPGVLTASQATSGFFLSDGTGFFSGIVDNIGGSISFVSDAAVSSTVGVTGSGNLANLVFTGLDEGSANLQFANLIFLNASLADIADVSAVGTSITVGAGNPIPTPSSALLVVAALLVAGFVSRTTQHFGQPHQAH